MITKDKIRYIRSPCCAYILIDSFYKTCFCCRIFDRDRKKVSAIIKRSGNFNKYKDDEVVVIRNVSIN